MKTPAIEKVRNLKSDYIDKRNRAKEKLTTPEGKESKEILHDVIGNYEMKILALIEAEAEIRKLY